MPTIDHPAASITFLSAGLWMIQRMEDQKSLAKLAAHPL